MLHNSVLCTGLVLRVVCFASQQLISQDVDGHLLIILFSKDEVLLVAQGAVNTNKVDYVMSNVIM
jgi:hypothetical protein